LNQAGKRHEDQNNANGALDELACGVPVVPERV
jgi:hypothetical protein